MRTVHIAIVLLALMVCISSDALAQGFDPKQIETVDTSLAENQVRIWQVDSTQRKQWLQSHYDTTAVFKRMASDSAFAQFENNSDYEYDQKLPENAISWWDVFTSWLRRQLLGLSSASNEAFGSFYTFVKYALIVLFCVLMGILLARANTNGLLFGNRRTLDIQHDELEENITVTDLDALHKTALSKQNYRKAVRYLYLIALRELNSRSIIDWQASKTNRQFIRETNGTPIQQPLRQLVGIFNYVWYGEFAIDGKTYEAIEKEFASFNTTLKNYKPTTAATVTAISGVQA